MEAAIDAAIAAFLMARAIRAVKRTSMHDVGVPKYTTQVDHELSQEDALARMREFVPSVKARFQEHIQDVEEWWTGHVLNLRFTTYGMRVTCALAAEVRVARLEYELPLAAIMFRGTIEQAVQSALRDALRR